MKPKTSSIWEKDPLVEITDSPFSVPKPQKKTKEERKLQRLERKLEKAKLAAQKAKQPKLSDLKKLVQKEVNAFVRKRDEGLACISCGKNCGPVQAGHYIAQGSSGALRYNLDNIHAQGTGCNLYKHGNLIEYRINLIKKIGLTRVEWLEEQRHDVKKWTREELNAIKNTIKDLSQNL